MESKKPTHPPENADMSHLAKAKDLVDGQSVCDEEEGEKSLRPLKFAMASDKVERQIFEDLASKLNV